MIYYFWFVITI